MRQDLTGLAPQRFEEFWISGNWRPLKFSGNFGFLEILDFLSVGFGPFGISISNLDPCTGQTKLSDPWRAVSVYLKYLKTNIVAMLAALHYHC